ncbi:MAG: type IV pilus assembly protein PilM [Candidatus Kaiserbacteria bacterium]|nr:type IV pilus assembly protein PilM [Candidatus Kaiserbacteria bacterium]
MSFLGEHLRAAFAPPRYLALPFSGIDISTSGVKAVRLAEDSRGLTLASYAEARLPAGACTDGEIIDRIAVVEALATAAREANISTVNVALPEPKSFLFETAVPGANRIEWRTAVEQHLDELIPLPPQETDFDIVEVGRNEQSETLIAGIGFARRVVDDTLSAFDQAHISVHALEGETFAMARALLPKGDTSTALVIDIGKTTTKISIVAGRIPRFATTIGIGGHALTLAVQKYFGVTETEARKVKSERGIVPAAGNEEYLAAMLSTVSAIRDEISRRLDYWQGKVLPNGMHEPVTHAILAGGNASVRGLPEYLEGALKIPVVLGNVFTNLASSDTWVPSLDYTESLAYATAIGLALYDNVQTYAQ